jgi:formiminoglutamase
VLFGIPEDIGIRANFVDLALLQLDSAIKSIATSSTIDFAKETNFFILGQLNVSAEMKR